MFNSPDDILQQILIGYVGLENLFNFWVLLASAQRKMCKADKRQLIITLSNAHTMLAYIKCCCFFLLLVREIAKCIVQSYETADRHELVRCFFPLSL